MGTIILGVLLLCVGVVWFGLTALAAGMASRQTTKWENLRPFIGVLITLIGIVVVVVGVRGL